MNPSNSPRQRTALWHTLLWCTPLVAGAQMRVDSTSDSVRRAGDLIVLTWGDSVDSKLGKVVPWIVIGCHNHDAPFVGLEATVAPAVLVRRNAWIGEQTIEVQADSSKKVKVNMVVGTFGRERLMVAEPGDDKKFLLAMASARRLTAYWKLWNFETVAGTFSLDTNETDRRAKVAAPWLSCKQKPLW